MSELPNKRSLLLIAGCALMVAVIAAARTLVTAAPPPTGVPLAEALPVRDPSLARISLTVEKSAGRLTVLYDGKPVKTYPVVFGRNPVDDKLREGDGCTPEGTFKVIGHRTHGLWSRFLWLDYPNQRSWGRFRSAKREKKIPENASIGGEIGIHGVPDKRDDLIDRRVHWTAGCISLKTGDIVELYRYTRVGTEVTILH